MKLYFRTFILAGICIIMAVALLLSQEAFAAKGGGGNGNGGGNAGGGNSGEDEQIYEASGDLIEPGSGDSIFSTNLNFNDIIFRPGADYTLNLGGFSVADPAGGTCPGNFGSTTGTMVLGPGDTASPGSAELRFGFQAQLSDNGKSAQHFLVMQGTMVSDNPADAQEWPPTEDFITVLTMTSWHIAAENKKSQRTDCQGEGDGVSEFIGVTPTS